MTRYAEGTTVPIERTRAEIERTLSRFGATAFSYGWDESRAVIAFKAHKRGIRFVLPMPAQDEILKTPAGYLRNETAQKQALEAAQRQRWRALLLVIKAKLEAVESGITSFEDEFLSGTILPDGSTAGEWLRPQIARAYEIGQMPALMPALGRGE